MFTIMKVTGFTFIKNAIIYDYPVVEAIQSILPICDEFVVAVGKSDDETLNLIKNIDKVKIRIIETEWDENLREGGRVLAVETDKAFQAISDDSDWAFYIQGDEVIHEKYLDTIYDAMKYCNNNTQIDGLLFKYLHFYGSYDYVGTASHWYKNEIRVIKNNKKIYSYQDAQGFRKNENEKLNAYPIDAYVYHYGWVKEPEAMQKKQETFHKLWHDDNWVDENVAKTIEFDYTSNINELKKFGYTHPAIISNRITTKNWEFEFDISLNKKSIKDKFKDVMLSLFGWEIGYKNYRIVRK